MQNSLLTVIIFGVLIRVSLCCFSSEEQNGDVDITNQILSVADQGKNAIRQIASKAVGAGVGVVHSAAKQAVSTVAHKGFGAVQSVAGKGVGAVGSVANKGIGAGKQVISMAAIPFTLTKQGLFAMGHRFNTVVQAAKGNIAGFNLNAQDILGDPTQLAARRGGILRANNAIDYDIENDVDTGCQCKETKCICCLKTGIPWFKKAKSGCISVYFDPETVTFKIQGLYDNQVVFNTRITVPGVLEQLNNPVASLSDFFAHKKMKPIHFCIPLSIPSPFESSIGLEMCNTINFSFKKICMQTRFTLNHEPFHEYNFGCMHLWVPFQRKGFPSEMAGAKKRTRGLRKHTSVTVIDPMSWEKLIGSSYVYPRAVKKDI